MLNNSRMYARRETQNKCQGTARGTAHPPVLDQEAAVETRTILALQTLPVSRYEQKVEGAWGERFERFLPLPSVRYQQLC